MKWSLWYWIDISRSGRAQWHSNAGNFSSKLEKDPRLTQSNAYRYFIFGECWGSKYPHYLFKKNSPLHTFVIGWIPPMKTPHHTHQQHHQHAILVPYLTISRLLLLGTQTIPVPVVSTRTFYHISIELNTLSKHLVVGSDRIGSRRAIKFVCWISNQSEKVTMKMSIPSLPVCSSIVWMLLSIYPLSSQSFTLTSSHHVSMNTFKEHHTCGVGSRSSRSHRLCLSSSTTNNKDKENENSASMMTTTTYSPIFDFAAPDQKAVEKFERIDDAIMGGISLSSMKQSTDEDFARWSGICRLDGGYVGYNA